MLRDIDKMAYKNISELLASQGYMSPRGCSLNSKIVFSIYKKRKIRDVRLTAIPRMKLKDLKFIY